MHKSKDNIIMGATLVLIFFFIGFFIGVSTSKPGMIFICETCQEPPPTQINVTYVYPKTALYREILEDGQLSEEVYTREDLEEKRWL